MTVKNTVWKHRSVLITYFWVTVFFATFWFLYRDTKPVWFTLLFFYLIDVIPGLYLHIKYFAQNKGEEYEISACTLLRRKNGQVFSYRSDEISKIEIFMTPSVYKGSDFHLLTIESYYYAQISLKDSTDRLVITCLIAPNLEEFLKNLPVVSYERHKVFFPDFE